MKGSAVVVIAFLGQHLFFHVILEADPTPVVHPRLQRWTVSEA